MKTKLFGEDSATTIVGVLLVIVLGVCLVLVYLDKTTLSEVGAFLGMLAAFGTALLGFLSGDRKSIRRDAP